MSKAKQVKNVDHLISDSDSEPVVAKKTQPTKQAGKKPVQKDSDDSSDDEVKFINTKKAREEQKTTAKAGVKKQAVESDDDSEDVKPKNGVKKPVGKKVVENDSEDEAPKKTAGKAQPAAKKAPVKKPADSDDDDSDELPKKTQPAKKAPVKKPVDSDDDSEEVVVAKKTTAQPAKKAPVKKPADSDDDSDSEEVAPKKTAPAKKAPVKADSDSDEDSDEAPKKTAPVKTQPESNSGCTELFLKNLSWNTDDNMLYEFFGNYGTVNNVKVLYDKTTGKARGLAFVEFATRAEAQAAIDDAANLNVDNRLIQVTFSDQKDANRAPQQGGYQNGGGSYGNGSYGNKGGSVTQSNYDGEKHTIFVGNLGFRTTEQSVKNFFKDCGNVVDVRIAKDRDTGKSKGFCHVDFDAATAVEKAKGKAGQDLDGREVRVDASLPKQGGGGAGGFGGRKYIY
jgi:nucleolin